MCDLKACPKHVHTVHKHENARIHSLIQERDSLHQQQSHQSTQHIHLRWSAIPPATDRHRHRQQATQRTTRTARDHHPNLIREIDPQAPETAKQPSTLRAHQAIGNMLPPRSPGRTPRPLQHRWQAPHQELMTSAWAGDDIPTRLPQASPGQPQFIWHWHRRQQQPQQQLPVQSRARGTAVRPRSTSRGGCHAHRRRPTG